MQDSGPPKHCDSPNPGPITVDVTVVLLAGGKSTRMGKDKLSLSLSELNPARTLLQHMVGIAAGLRLPFIVAGGEHRLEKLSSRGADLPALTLCKDGPGFGPAAGILGAASLVPESALLVVACDMPFLTTPLLRSILQTALDRDADLVMPEVDSKNQPQRRRHPLVAFYSPRALRQLRRQVLNGHYSLQRLASDLCSKDLSGADLCNDHPSDHDTGASGTARASVAIFPGARDLGVDREDLERQLFNCNTPQDWEEARRLKQR